MSNLVPDGWSIYNIKDVALSSDRYSFTGGPFGSNLKSEDYTEQGIRIIQLQNIGDGVFKNKYKIYTSEEKANELHSCNIYPNDIILSKMGDPVARAVIMPDYATRYLMASDGIRLAVDNTKFDTKYVHDTINSVPFRTQAEIHSTGSTRKRIGLTELRQLTFIAPPLPEQQKIAKILTSVDEVIEKTQAQIDKLKDLKTGMMQELLTNGIGHTEFKDSPVGIIPAEWEVKKLSDVTKVVDSLHQTPTFSDDGLPMIRVGDIREGKVNISKAMKVSDKVFSQFTKNHQPTKGDILMSRVGSYGVCCYIDNDVKVCIGQNTVVIISTSIEYLFLFNLLNSYIVQNQIEFEVAGSGYKSLSLASIRNLTIILPNRNEQKKISNIFHSLDSKIELLNNKLSSIKNTKKALTQDLLTGQVRVKTKTTNTEVAVG